MICKLSGRFAVSFFSVFMVLALLLSLSSQFGLNALATETRQHEKRLAALQEYQLQLEQEQEQHQKELNTLNSQKDKLAEKLLLLEEESSNLVLQIENTEQLILQYGEKIDTAKEDIRRTEEDYAEFYDLFCDRLLDIRKTGASHSVWSLVFTADSMADFFTSIRRIRYLAESDQNIMETLAEMEEELSAKKEALEKEQAAQAEQLKKQEEHKKQLEKTSEEFNQTLKQVKQDIKSFSERIQQLKRERGQVEFEISNEEEVIRSLKEAEAARILEKAKKELEEAERQEAEAAEKAEREQAAQREEESSKESESRPAESKPSVSAPAPSKPVQAKPVESKPVESKPAESAPEESKSESSEPAPSKPAQSTSSDSASTSATAVIDYASQFLGNPYVWGGNSLTNGCDCSGFVQQVFKHFGIYLPRTSNEMRVCDVGYRVSLDDLIPGDLVCYDGHIGIYVGDGKMINALNAKYGIVISSIYRGGTGKNPICGRRLL